MGRWQTRIQFGTYRGPSGPRYVPNWIRDLPSPIDCMYTKSLSAIYDLDFCSAILAHFLCFCPFDRCRLWVNPTTWFRQGYTQVVGGKSNQSSMCPHFDPFWRLKYCRQRLKTKREKNFIIFLNFVEKKIEKIKA